MRLLKTDLVDEHYYRDEQWFILHADRYDSYDRNGPKVLADEYSCHETNRKLNYFNASLLYSKETMISFTWQLMLRCSLTFKDVNGVLISFGSTIFVLLKLAVITFKKHFSVNKVTNVLPLKMNDRVVCKFCLG